MFSIVSPGFFYQDTSRDIVESDIDIVSDLWTFDDREVYRGSRDKRYSHANVYWLYSEELERVGCVEHDPINHSNFQTLWFYENPFATLFQEEEWETHDTLWMTLPQRSAELFLANGWTTPSTFLEHCLNGSTRIVTPSMLRDMPCVYGCVCGKLSLTPIEHPGALAPRPLDFSSKEKILFLDDDMIVYVPPTDSRVWSLLSMRPQQPDAGSSQVPEQAQVLPHREPTPPLLPQPTPLPASPEQVLSP